MNAIDSTLGVPVSDYTDEARLRELAENAEDRGEGICRTCLAPIWNEGGTIGKRHRPEGWSDRIERGGDSLVCFKAVHYRHVPLTGREACIYDRAHQRGAATTSAELVGLRTQVDQLRGENERLRESAETATFAANRLGEIANGTEERREDDRLHYDAEANTLRVDRAVLLAENETLRRSRNAYGDLWVAEKGKVAALQARIDALAEDWRSLLAIGKTPFNETTDAQLQRWRTELDILGVYSVLDRIDAANIAAWIEYRAAVGVGVDPQNGEAEV